MCMHMNYCSCVITRYFFVFDNYLPLKIILNRRGEYSLTFTEPEENNCKIKYLCYLYNQQIYQMLIK